MTPHQRAVLVGLGGVVAVLVAVLVVRAATQSNHTSTLAATTETTAPASDVASTTTPTTLQLLPIVPTEPPTTPTSTPASTVPATAPVTTTSTAPPRLNGSGAVLTAPASSDERVEPPGVGCAGLADAGWSGVHCGLARASGATLTWLIESRSASSSAVATRAYVFRLTPGGTQQEVLQALDDNGQRFTAVQARVDSVEGGGAGAGGGGSAGGGGGGSAADIVFGFRNQGSAEMLSLDLVQGPGVVAVHQDLYRGVARTASGQLDTWSAVLAAGDANCCPSAYQHDTVKYVGRTWTLVAEESVPPSAVPPSQL